MDPLQTFTQDAMTAHDQPSIVLQQAVQYQLLDNVTPHLLARLQLGDDIPQHLPNFDIILDELVVVLLADYLDYII